MLTPWRSLVRIQYSPFASLAQNLRGVSELFQHGPVRLAPPFARCEEIEHQDAVGPVLPKLPGHSTMLGSASRQVGAVQIDRAIQRDVCRQRRSVFRNGYV